MSPYRRGLTPGIENSVSLYLTSIGFYGRRAFMSLPGIDFGLSRWAKRGWILGTTPMEQKEFRLRDTFTHFTIDSCCPGTARSYFSWRSVGYIDPEEKVRIPELQKTVERLLYRGVSSDKKQWGLGFNIPPLPWYQLDPYFFVKKDVLENPVFSITHPTGRGFRLH